MKKEEMGIESSCAKTKMFIRNSKEEILVVAALRETELKNQDESEQKSIFG